MKNFMFIFVIIVISLYTLVNYFIFSRGYSAISHLGNIKWIYVGLFIFLSLSYIVYRFLERNWVSPVTDFFGWIGSFWFAAMAYFLLSLLIIDLFRLANYFIPFFPDWIKTNSQNVKMYLFLGVLTLTSLTIIIGYINNLYPTVRKLSIHVDKPSPIKNLRIVMASDIHLCPIMGTGKVDKLVSLTQSLKPDIILLAGDILDENPIPVIVKKIGEPLKQLHAPLGFYGILGNHEYIGGTKERANI